MSEQTIQSHDITVTDVFQSFYAVPNYQREYVWKTEQVVQLLSDINGERAGANPETAPEYFIGSIVVCPGHNGVFDVIDGQQRLTTLFVTLCAIRDRIKELRGSAPSVLNLQVAATSVNAAGRECYRYRIELQYEDSGGVLEQIGTGDKPEGQTESKTRSITNIRNAYQVALKFLREQFSNDSDSVRAFYGYLTNKVKLIRIQTEDVAKALKIFETINDRGVGLDAMDLLKNLLFMKSSREQFDKLKTIWKDLQDAIYNEKEKPLRFLRYFILSRYDVNDLLREDDIYKWFSQNESACGYASNPLRFAKELLDAAKAYCHFLNGRDQHGQRNRFLENLQLLGGKAARNI